MIRACNIINPTIESMSRPELLALQERRLLAQVKRAYATIPYYRRTLPTAAAELTSIQQFSEVIPFINKSAILDAQKGGLANIVAEPGSPLFWLHMTSGTSGLGQEVHPLTRLDVEALGLGWTYQAHWAGLNLGDSVFYTFPVGMQTGGLSSFPMSDRMSTLNFHTGPYDTRKKIEYLLRFKPRGMVIAPAFLNRFQALLTEMGVDPRQKLSELKAIFVAGESYSLEWVLRAQEFWGTQISEWYGLMQGGMNMCFSCESGVAPNGQRGHLHTLEHRFFCEVLHPDSNESVSPGETGEMVVTPLFREAFPVIRFRTGDRVRLMPEPCACGRPFASIEAGTIARYDDMLRIRGQNLWPDAVDRLVFAAGDVEEYAGRVFVDDQGREIADVRLEFRAALGLSADDRAKRLTEISDEVRRNLNVRLDFVEVSTLTLPRFEFKTRRWTDERRSDRHVIRYTTT
jgi:phenylacetate-CoA ligase